MDHFELGCVQAPSNIALIKYMGKKSVGINIPENSNLSLTLNKFRTYTFYKITKVVANEVPEVSYANLSPEEWLPMTDKGHFESFNEKSWCFSHLSDEEIDKTNRTIKNALPQVLSLLRAQGFQIVKDQKIELRTVSTFPASVGIASSASSMASLTLALFFSVVVEKENFKTLFHESTDLKKKIASLSREASGSSCRSFMGPWVSWSDDQINTLDTGVKPFPEFSDLLVLLSSKKKEVSSSVAHQRVKSSLRWGGRFERAQSRYNDFSIALKNQNFKKCAEISFDEFQDMHDLFHTSNPPFSYFIPETKEIIEWFLPLIKELDEPPFLTMDAGPNVHFIIQRKNVALWKNKIAERFPHFNLLIDEQGYGASILGSFKSKEGLI